MAVGVDPASANPFGDLDVEGDQDEKANKLPTISPSPSTTVLPFIRVPILLLCTATVFVLMIAGTATTALAYPPKSSQVQPVLDGDSKLIGPLMLTAGCFLFIVDIVLCTIMTREAYFSSRMVQPANKAWNNQKSAPVSLVGGPFYIATPGPALTNAPIAPFHTSPWVYPNAPLDEFPLDNGKSDGRTPQPPFNPDSDPSSNGA